MSRSLFKPVSLKAAVEKLGFIQADPIRAPARAQDLTLRHRVVGYRVGDLDRRYAALGIDEDVLINYGYVSGSVYALMHPRQKTPSPSPAPRSRPHKLLAYVREQGEAHPREVDAHFAHGTVTNYWGGTSSATTHLLEELHYRGWLRVSRRDRGVRVYSVHARPGDSAAPEPSDRVDALVDVVVNKYAPLPLPSLSDVVRRLRYAVPQWRRHLPGALQRARNRLAHARVDGVEWYWPAGERPRSSGVRQEVRLLAPFDPVVWDRRRFELLWGWPYRFEAYTPSSKRRFGYYALPLLFGDRVIGWGNLSVDDGELRGEFGYVGSRPPRGPRFRHELDADLDRMRRFLGLQP